MPLSSKEYARLAIPLTLSTLTQPLLSAVDTAVVGQLSNAEYIAGITIGAVLFNTMYWLFGFLRVTTTGISAQSRTKQDDTLILLRGLTIALSIGLTFIIFQKLIFNIAVILIKPAPGVIINMEKYFRILIYGAPLVLSHYVMLGFLMGKARIKETLLVQISGNILNIILDFIFVFVLGYDIGGVAIATLISIFFSTLLGVLFIRDSLTISSLSKNMILDKTAVKELFTVNSDLFYRTVFLLARFNLFLYVGASFGTELVAANGILIQIGALLTQFFDGLANASSIYSGRAKGNGNKPLLDQAIKESLKAAAFVIIILTSVYMFASEQIINLFTNVEEVTRLAIKYRWWVALIPLSEGFGLTMYGIFTGFSHTRPVRNSTFLALCLFVLFLYFTRSMGNHGLWLAYTVFALGRSLFLNLKINRLYDYFVPVMDFTKNNSIYEGDIE